MINTVYSSEEIKLKREQVRSRFCATSQNVKNGAIQKIGNLDLRTLFTCYDGLFFDDYFKRKFCGDITFTLSRRLKRAAGTTRYSKKLNMLKPEQFAFDIRISADFIFNYYGTDRDKRVNGVISRDPLDALMLVFEHELCHVIECLYFLESNCKGARFQQLAKNLFGHTEIHHELPTNAEVNSIKYGVKPGDSVTFEFRGSILSGSIVRINKRATVMVADKKGQYADQWGKRYIKFLIPLNKLSRISNLD